MARCGRERALRRAQVLRVRGRFPVALGVGRYVGLVQRLEESAGPDIAAGATGWART